MQNLAQLTGHSDVHVVPVERLCDYCTSAESLLQVSGVPPRHSIRWRYTNAAMRAMSGGPLWPIMLRHNRRSEMKSTTPHAAMKAQP